MADLQWTQTVYPHKWWPVSCRSSAGQGKFAGQRPTFYHCVTQPTSAENNTRVPGRLKTYSIKSKSISANSRESQNIAYIASKSWITGNNRAGVKLCRLSRICLVWLVAGLAATVSVSTVSWWVGVDLIRRVERWPTRLEPFDACWWYRARLFQSPTVMPQREKKQLRNPIV